MPSTAPATGTRRAWCIACRPTAALRSLPVARGSEAVRCPGPSRLPGRGAQIGSPRHGGGRRAGIPGARRHAGRTARRGRPGHRRQPVMTFRWHGSLATRAVLSLPDKVADPAHGRSEGAGYCAGRWGCAGAGGRACPSPPPRYARSPRPQPRPSRRGVHGPPRPHRFGNALSEPGGFLLVTARRAGPGAGDGLRTPHRMTSSILKCRCLMVR